LELAREKGVLEQVHNDMLLFDRICKQNRDLVRMLQSPIIASDKKFEILKKVFGTQMNAISVAFLDILRKKNRESYLPAISKEVHRQYNKLHGIRLARVITAVPLDTTLRDAIQKLSKQIAGSDIEFHEEVNPSVVGGFQLLVEDKILDLSVKKQLLELKRQFSYNPYQKGF
jgi:F-type H+-transporting ATPase subunit delta